MWGLAQLLWFWNEELKGNSNAIFVGVSIQQLKTGMYAIAAGYNFGTQFYPSWIMYGVKVTSFGTCAHYELESRLTVH